MSDSENTDTMMSDEKVIIDLNANKKSENEVENKVEQRSERPADLRASPERTFSPELQRSEPVYTVIPEKRIDELTDEDKKVLINNARSGIDNPYYTVKLFKNGNTRICKKKKNSISKEAVESNGERTIKNQNSDKKVYMTDNQLIWEHLFELENKYNTLYRKHKKLKSKYNDLYIEDDTSYGVKPEDEQQQQPDVKDERSTGPERLREQQQQPEVKDEQQQQQLQQQLHEPLIQRNPLSWRQALMQRTRNSYMN